MHGIRFIALSAADQHLVVSKDGSAVTQIAGSKRDNDLLPHVYLDRPLDHTEVLQLAIKRIPNQRNTFTIGVGATTCGQAAIRANQYHAFAACDRLKCASDGGSVFSLLGLVPVAPTAAAGDKSSPNRTTLTIKRLSNNVLSISLDGQKFDLLDRTGVFPAGKSTLFLVLTPDVKAVRITKSEAGSKVRHESIKIPITETVNSSNGNSNSRSGSPLVATSTSTERILTIAEVTSGHEGRPRPLYPDMEFVLPTDAHNIQVSEDNKVISRKSVAFARSDNLAHMSKDLGVGQRLVMQVGKTTLQMQNSASFQLGFTRCDLTTVEKIQEHKKDCGRLPGKVCNESIAQSISAFACNGAVVMVERSDKAIDVTITRNGIVKTYPMKLCNAPKDGAAYINPKRIYYPFVVLNGITDVVKILSSEDVPASLPARLTSNFVPQMANGSDLSDLLSGRTSRVSLSEDLVNFRFLLTPYPNPSIQVSEDRLRVTRTGLEGPKIAYFDRKIDIGGKFVLKILRYSGPRGKYSFRFGATTCSKSMIQGNESHVQGFCDDSATCGGKTVIAEVWNCSKQGDMVAVERKEKTFDIEVIHGAYRKKYVKWISNMGLESHAWFPFIVLDDEVSSLEFCDSLPPDPGISSAGALPQVRTPRLNHQGMVEMADKLVASLDPPRTPAPAAAPAPNLTPKSFPPLPAPLTPVKAPLVAAAAAKDVPVEKIDCTFVKSYYDLDNIEIAMEGRQATRTDKSGSRLVYLDMELMDGASLTIKVMRDNKHVHQKAVSFSFGLTTCSLKTIHKYSDHAKGTCHADSSRCGGSSCLYAVSAAAHAGSTVLMQRKAESVEMKITSPTAQSIEVMKIPRNISSQAVVPFFQLSGNADEISIVSAALPAGAERESKPIYRIPMSMPAARSPSVETMSVGSSDVASMDGDGNSGIGFLYLPYKINDLYFSDNNQKVRRTHGPTQLPIFFDREIKIGQSVVMEAEGSAMGSERGNRFEFGFTSCTLDSIVKHEGHLVKPCSRIECGGESLEVMMRYNPRVVSAVTVTRLFDHFAFDIGKGWEKKRFQKHFRSPCHGPEYHWIPYIRLIGDVDSVRLSAFRDRNANNIDNSPSTRAAHSRSSSPFPGASPLTPVLNGAAARREATLESRISPVRVVNARPTTKAFVETAVREVVGSPVNTHRSMDLLASSRVSVPAATSTPASSPSTLTAQKPREKLASVQVKEPSMPVIPAKEAAKSVVPAKEPVKPVVTEGAKAPVTIAKRKWYGNAAVSFNDPFMSRTDDPGDAKGYILSPKLLVHEKIGFKGIRVEGAKAKIAFGVTSNPILKVDVTALPDNPADLENVAGWYVLPTLASCVGIWDGLVVSRTESGISLMLPNDPDSEFEIISDIPPSVTVFPFFQFSGCKIEILYDV